MEGRGPRLRDYEEASCGFDRILFFLFFFSVSIGLG